MAAIINSGLALITSNLQAGLPTIISEFVLADIPALDHTLPIDDGEVIPSLADISWRGPVTRAAAIQPDKVVYSLLLDGTVGDFDFSWIGLVADNGTLVAVAYVPRQQKFKYAASVMGNTITRNFVLAFAGAQGAFNITISPETWQFDFTDYIRAELEKGLLVQTVTANMVARNSGHYRFMAHAILTLHDSLPDGTQIRTLVDHSVNLSAGNCVVEHSLPINTSRGADLQINIIETSREFVFVKINNQWRVS